MEEMQCSQEIILSFINKMFFVTKFQDIPKHFEKNVEIPWHS